MNTYDATILQGTYPAPPAKGEASAAPGHSYYWDRRAEGHDHESACRLAARDMGTALYSIRRVAS